MRTLSALLLLIVLAVTLPASARQSPTAALGSQGALFEQALAQAGLTPEDMRFNMHDRAFWGGDKFRLPFFDALQDDPWKISPYTRKLTDMLAEQADNPASVLVQTQSRLNQGVRLGLTGDPLAEYEALVKAGGENCLASALSDLAFFTETYQPEEVTADDFLTEDYFRLPLELREAAALVIYALQDAQLHRHVGLIEPVRQLAAAGGSEEHVVISDLIEHWCGIDPGRGDPEQFRNIEMVQLTEQLAEAVDFTVLNAGASLLTLAVARAAERVKPLRDAELPDARINLRTAYGNVCIATRLETAEAGLLTFSLSGDTIYRPGWNYLGYWPVSVIIDAGGNDHYLADFEPASNGMPSRVPYATGCFGYGLLFDLDGDDTYSLSSAEHPELTIPGLGFGFFGTGLLHDAGGNDEYYSIANAQGCGIYGTGILIDAGGDDVYHAYHYSQGYGYTLGIGLLLDAGGNDIYVADDDDIRAPSAQTREHNLSMCQGMGNGRRADYTDGHSWAGGIGMLVDGAGDDYYSCGVFGQGCSYWYGTGILADKGGNDFYHGVWYVQGSGAHFGLSVFQDDAGDDFYWASHNMAQGAGHDWTLSWFEDSAGNDHYIAPNLSLGGANANGIGVFWDKAGDDVYRSQGVTLGCGGGVSSPSLREYMLNLGVFVDGGGRDSYLEITARDQENPDAPIETRPWDFAGDGKAWQREGKSSPPVQREYGVGIDAAD